MEDDRDGHACDGGGYGPPWMCEDEYLASLRDIPDEVLDAAPEGMPEELWLAAVEIEAARMPDPLADPQASWAGAGQARAIAELAQRRVTAGGQGELAFYVDEVALALTCSRQAAWAKVHTVLGLVDRLPETLTAVASGQICAVRARIIAEDTRALTDADARLVQDEVLAAAEVLTPSPLRARVAAAVAAVDPRDADEQHEDACAARAVKKYPREHGMTGIWALLPADHAATVWAAVNTHAESGRETGDDRTADQRRADSLIDLMTAYLNGTCPADILGFSTTLAPAAQAFPAPPEGDTEPRAAVSTKGRDCHAPGGAPAAQGAVLVSGPDQDLSGLAARTQHRSTNADRPWTITRGRRPETDRRRGLAANRLRPTHRSPAGRRHDRPRPAGIAAQTCPGPRRRLHPADLRQPTRRSRPQHPVSARPDQRGQPALALPAPSPPQTTPQWIARARPDGRIDWITPTGHIYPEHPPDLRPPAVGRPHPEPRIGPESCDLEEQPDSADDTPPF